MHQKIKYNWQVFRFEYPDRKAPPVIDKKTGKEKPKTRGRALDFIGFVFHYNRTTLRKSILKRATKKAHRIAKKEKVNWYDASAMLASMGWFTHTDTYGFYEDHIKPYVNIKQLKKKVSKHSKKGVKTMMSEWYQSESMDKPTEWDTTSSPTVVYQRKSIAEQIRKGIDGEKDRTVYVYSERTMTQEEYARLQAELESPATKMIMQSMSSIEMNVAMMQEMMEV